MNPINLFALAASYWRLQFSAVEMWIAWWSVAWQELHRPGVSGGRDCGHRSRSGAASAGGARRGRGW